VDDGSHDATGERVAAFAQQSPVPVALLTLPENRGKGCAVRAGMTTATGAFRVFSDADASTPIAEIEKMWPHFDAGADVVIGSRALARSDVQVRQAWYRQTMGRIFNIILRIFALTPFKDTQCGFKGFTAAACGSVFPLQTVERFSFDAELLFIAARLGMRIVEIPVIWRNNPQSKVNPIWDSSRMFLDLMRIRWNALTGRYD
jgi:dolichyl-phosphate beta-glucosyltransferase